jgi:hypothetical protein
MNVDQIEAMQEHYNIDRWNPRRGDAVHRRIDVSQEGTFRALYILCNNTLEFVLLSASQLVAQCCPAILQPRFLTADLAIIDTT